MKIMSKKAIAIATVVLGISAAAIAGPKFTQERIYYSDASKTQIVGESVLACNGGFYSIGQVTPYYRTLAQERCR